MVVELGKAQHQRVSLALMQEGWGGEFLCSGKIGKRWNQGVDALSADCDEHAKLQDRCDDALALLSQLELQGVLGLIDAKVGLRCSPN